jgi:hypothetical protein
LPGGGAGFESGVGRRRWKAALESGVGKRRWPAEAEPKFYGDLTQAWWGATIIRVARACQSRATCSGRAPGFVGDNLRGIQSMAFERPQAPHAADWGPFRGSGG